MLGMVEVNVSTSPLKKSEVNDWLPAWRTTTSPPSKATSVGVATRPLSLAKSVHSPQQLELVMLSIPVASRGSIRRVVVIWQRTFPFLRTPINTASDRQPKGLHM